MSGSSDFDEPGSYGEKGVPSPSNVPRSRNSAVGWRENVGNLWMFGGSCYYTSVSNNGIVKQSVIMPYNLR
jgi:hypothetical protein